MLFTVAIPVFNNEGTVLDVALRARKSAEDVLVVDDGSTLLPQDFDGTLARNGIRLVRHAENRGKGAAIQTALQDCLSRNVDYMIVLDADGQHLPEDIPQFIAALEGTDGSAIAVGVRDFSVENVPSSSRFGRSFSNFWVKLETGVTCGDTQSGFRAYPVKPISLLRLNCQRYNFEIEVLVKALWGGCPLVELPIHVKYEPPEKRVSHFRPFMDNFRLSILHTKLVLRRLLPFGSKSIVEKHPSDEGHTFRELLLHPKKFLLYLLNENATPLLLGVSAGVGSLLACLPLIGVHTLVILYVCLRLRLNKIMAVVIQNLYMPPFAPFLCIELGYFMRNGEWLTSASLKTISGELHLRLLEWLLGSLVLGPVSATIIGTIIYFSALSVNAIRRKKSQ